MKKIVWTAMVVALLVTPVVAEDGDDDNLSAGVEIGFRAADISGNGDKYREDVNLSDGAIRLFAVDLEWEPADSGFADKLRFDASGLGGEPHSSARFSLEKTGRYDLDLKYRSSDYFYRDAGYFFRTGGDYHTWDARRDFLGLGVKVQATDNIRLRFGADRMEREGGSTSTRGVQRDEFVLTRPVDQSAMAYWAAADFRFGWADLTVEQRFTTNENRWLLTTSASDGEEPGGAFLDDYSQLRVEDADAPISRISVSGRPVDWFRFQFGYARVDADLDYSTTGAWSGVDYTSAPFDTTLTNIGNLERKTDRIDLDLSFRVSDDFDVTLDFANRDYQQDGAIDSTEVQTGGAEAGTYLVQGNLRNDLDLMRYGLTLTWRATSTLTLSAGGGVQTRDADFELSGPPVETERTLVRAGVAWRPDKTFNLRFDLEQGEDDDPLTAVSPTSIDRIRVRADVKPIEGLTLRLGYRDESRENDLVYPIGLPTDDVPPATDISLAEFDVSSWNIEVGWNKGPVDLWGGFSSTQVDSNAHIVYVTGSQFFPTFDIFTTRDSTRYSSDQEVVHGNFAYRFSDKVRMGLRAAVADSSGSFPVESNVYGGFVRVDVGKGLYLRGAFDSYDYEEQNPFAGEPTAPTPDVNDYDADLFTVALGYRFD